METKAFDEDFDHCKKIIVEHLLQNSFLLSIF